MGVISGASQNQHKSASYIYAKIKREFKSFGNANLLDDADFPLYTAEVLKKLGNAVYKEEQAILKVKNGKAKLPKDFMQLYAAYKCKCTGTQSEGRHLQNKTVFENDITCETLSRQTHCKINCECPDKIIERVTVRQYVNDVCVTHNYGKPTLLKLSPNVQPHCSEDCLNTLQSCQDEITMNNGCFFTNFSDGDIFLLYYAFPFDENGLPEIPNIQQVESAVEAYIKWQILLNFWIMDDVANVLQKAQYYQQEYERALAECRFINKLPAFSSMINSIRNKRATNMVSFFAQQDKFN